MIFAIVYKFADVDRNVILEFSTKTNQSSHIYLRSCLHDVGGQLRGGITPRNATAAERGTPPRNSNFLLLRRQGKFNCCGREVTHPSDVKMLGAAMQAVL
jgi:hypothetical protein